MCTHGASLPPPVVLRGACSGCSKSLELASNHGIAFRLAEPPRSIETPQFNIYGLLLLYYACTAPCPKLSSSLDGGRYGTTAVAHQARLLL